MNTQMISGMEAWHFDALPSTNGYIKDAFRQNNALPMPLCVYADSQSAGRGRMTRTFVSPGGGLYMSVLLPAASPEEAAGKTPLAAVAVCRALYDLGVRDARIKWVNDVYLHDKKICGILCEGVPGGVIIGIGVNVSTPEDGFPREAGPAGAIDRPNVTRNKLLEGILHHLPKAIACPEDALQTYRAVSLLTGREVICQVGDRTLTGTVTGISDGFGLNLIREDGEEMTLHSGEVTRVRPLRKAAFFDFDGTVRKGDSIVPYVSFIRKQGKMPLRQYVQVLFATLGYLTRLCPSTKPKTAALAYRKALSSDEQAALDQAFAKWLLDTAYQDALQKWQELKKEGCTMVLLSASTENYMQYVAQLLEADALLCTPVEEDGTVKHNCHGREKVVRAEAYAQEAGIDFSKSCSFGDSGSDIFILTHVKDGYAVNPKKKLVRLAARHNLPILHWR